MGSIVAAFSGPLDIALKYVKTQLPQRLVDGSLIKSPAKTYRRTLNKTPLNWSRSYVKQRTIAFHNNKGATDGKQSRTISDR